MVEDNIKKKDESDEANQKAEAVKALRKTHKQRIEKVAERVKEQRRFLKAISAKLADSACTVPEIANSIDMPSDKVLWYVATMKKYGQIVEKDKDNGYYRYSLQGEHHVSN